MYYVAYFCAVLYIVSYRIMMFIYAFLNSCIICVICGLFFVFFSSLYHIRIMLLIFVLSIYGIVEFTAL